MVVLVTRWPSRHIRMSLEERRPCEVLLRRVCRHPGHVTREDDVGTPGILGVQLLPVAVRALGEGHGHGGAIVHLNWEKTKNVFLLSIKVLINTNLQILD